VNLRCREPQVAPPSLDAVPPHVHSVPMAEAEAPAATQALLKGSPDGVVICDIPVTDPGSAGEVSSPVPRFRGWPLTAGHCPSGGGTPASASIRAGNLAPLGAPRGGLEAFGGGFIFSKGVGRHLWVVCPFVCVGVVLFWLSVSLGLCVSLLILNRES